MQKGSENGRSQQVHQPAPASDPSLRAQGSLLLVLLVSNWLPGSGCTDPLRSLFLSSSCPWEQVAEHHGSLLLGPSCRRPLSGSCREIPSPFEPQLTKTEVEDPIAIFEIAMLWHPAWVLLLSKSQKLVLTSNDFRTQSQKLPDPVTIIARDAVARRETRSHYGLPISLSPAH